MSNDKAPDAPDRSDAVNLARNYIADRLLPLTPLGIETLAQAVMVMDGYIKETAAQQALPPGSAGEIAGGDTPSAGNLAVSAAPTPETDELLLEINEGRRYENDGAMADFARKLERERNEARAERDAARRMTPIANVQLSGDAEYWKGRADHYQSELAAVREQLAAANKRAKDAARWRAVPAFLEKYQLCYVSLLRDVDEFNGDKNG